MLGLKAKALGNVAGAGHPRSAARAGTWSLFDSSYTFRFQRSASATSKFSDFAPDRSLYFGRLRYSC